MIVRSAQAGGFVRVNLAFRDATGLTEDDLVGKPLLDWIDDRDHDTLRAALDGERGRCRVRHRGRNGESLTLDLQTSESPDGTVILGRADAAPRREETDDDRDDEATVRGTLATIAKIMEQQNPGYKCSILLVADGRFVRGAGPSLPDDYNSAIDGFAIGPTVGSCGTAIYWNVPVIVEDIQADPLWTPFAELAKKAGVAACWSHPFTSRSGNVLGALALYSPTPKAPTAEQLSRLAAAAGMTGLAVERGRAEEALRAKRKRELELEEQLRQAEKMEALGVLAGGVAHDFNNVLGTILGNAEFGLKLLPESSEVRELLEDIVTASTRAGDFCQQMLAYAGQRSRDEAHIDLGALVPQLSSLVQAAVSKKATLEYKLHDGPTYVEGDENQLLQVIMNLVTNAGDAIGDNEGSIVVSSAVEQYESDALDRLDPEAQLEAGAYVRLVVRDDGCGMDEETIARMFDPFFTTKVTGHGLGLAAVRGIVRAHRGALQIESEPGVGTSVTVVLPLISPPAQPESVQETNAAEGRQKRVLVADDEAALRSILCKQLRHSGYAVVEAADGQQTIDLFRKEPAAFDCVLLDLSMPELSGTEVLRCLRETQPDIPVVLMSGYAEKSVHDRTGDDDINGFLQKPVKADKLFSAINEALGPAQGPAAEGA